MREDNKKDYKGKGKRWYIVEEDSNENDDDIVYVAMKDDLDDGEAIAPVTCMIKNKRMDHK